MQDCSSSPGSVAHLSLTGLRPWTSLDLSFPLCKRLNQLMPLPLSVAPLLGSEMSFMGHTWQWSLRPLILLPSSYRTWASKRVAPRDSVSQAEPWQT